MRNYLISNLLAPNKRRKVIVRSLEEIQADSKRLVEEEKEALKAHKKDTVATVKKLIVEYKLTKGEINPINKDTAYVKIFLKEKKVIVSYLPGGSIYN